MTTDPVTPDDELDASRMPLLSHLSELRDRLFRVVIAILAGFIVCMFVADKIYEILLQPFQMALSAAKGGHEPVRLIFTAPLEFFIVKMKLAIFAGIVLVFPYVAYEIYAFVAPGLYKHERAAVVPYLIAGPLLFFAGLALVHFIVMPQLLTFSLDQEVVTAQARIELLPKVADYLSLTTTLMLAFGAAFQLPLVLMIMGQSGVVSAQFLARYRSWAIFGLAVFAAIVTPPDAISMLALLIPLYGLYEISIQLVKLIEKKRAASDPDGHAGSSGFAPPAP